MFFSKSPLNFGPAAAKEAKLCFQLLLSNLDKGKVKVVGEIGDTIIDLSLSEGLKLNHLWKKKYF